MRFKKTKSLLVWMFVFLVPFTQIVSFPVVYASNLIAAEPDAATAPAEPPNDTSQIEEIVSDEPLIPNEVEDDLSSQDIQTLKDLVILLVDKEIYDSSTSYVGLRSDIQSPHLNRNSIKERILDYAADIAKSNELTDVKLIFYNKEKDSVYDISRALENIYAEGIGDDEHKMTGVVIIGNVPLPVVNKNGNHFVSMYPYTDFVNKAYTYNENSREFERNLKVSGPKAEIWHGVIAPPEKTNEGLEKLALFFDKNHLYYKNDPRYANFDKKMFFGDLVQEEQKLNEDAYKAYKKYLDGLEDLVYMRYNKHWANELTQTLGDGALADPDNIDLATNGQTFFESISEGDTSIPDIYSKYLIDRMLLPYMMTLKKYISDVNDWSDYTGRYVHLEKLLDQPTQKKLDTDNVPGLITMKDEYAKIYLRSVNDALEKQVNQIAERIQEPITIIENSALTGKTANGETFKITVQKPDPDNPGQNSQDDANTVMKFHYLNGVDGKLYIKGIPLDILESPKQCTVYLGSTKNSYFDLAKRFDPKRLANGEYSIMTRSIRADDLATAIPVPTIGVNTRMLSPTTAYAISGGRVSNGAMVDDMAEYGIPAFLPNYLYGEGMKYKNPFDGDLKKGDVITKLSGRQSGSQNFSEAIEINSENSLESAVTKIFNAADVKRESVSASLIKWDLKLEFYRGRTKSEIIKSFKVNREHLANKNPAETGGDSDGAIFMLYSTTQWDSDGDTGSGYADKGFDLSAGCNAAMLNNDKCFYPVAQMAVLDPAGSTELKNINGDLKFQDNYEGNEDRMPILQYPAGYSYENIDEVYLNSCFDGVPGVDLAGVPGDLLEYKFPLDISTKNGNLAGDNDGGFKYYFESIFAGLVYNIGHYIFRGEADGFTFPREGTATMMDEAKPCSLPDDEKRGGCYPDRSEVWLDLDTMNAGRVVLNESPRITLQDFSDRYGLFDGIDNNKNGQIDEYAEEFLNPLESYKIAEINRRLLSHDGTYVLPSGVTLKVDASEENKKTISSVIIHNEPTFYTISKQLEAGTTESLPIDNPRYVAFQSISKIRSKGDSSNYFIPGRTEKVVYPNLFKANNYAQLKANLAVLANQIALIPGSYRIFGRSADPGDYTLKEIRDQILDEYLNPVVEGALDDPIDGNALTVAAENKVQDALNWLSLSIDDKHEYVLQTYLNPGKDAYIADNSTGYEAAYLVLNGNSDYYETSFNKDSTESDPLFDPLSNEYQEAHSETTDSGGDDDDDDDSSSEEPKNFITEWLEKELYPFLEEVQSIGEFENACVFSEEDNSDGNDDDESATSQLPLKRLRVSASSTNFPANGKEKVVVTVQGLDENGNQVDEAENGEIVTLKLIQNDSNPILKKTGILTANLINGVATFTFLATENTGNAVVSALSEASDVEDSEDLSITAGGNSVAIVTYTYGEIEGAEEYLNTISAGEDGGDVAGGEETGDEVVGSDVPEDTAKNAVQSDVDNVPSGGDTPVSSDGTDKTFSTGEQKSQTQTEEGDVDSGGSGTSGGQTGSFGGSDSGGGGDSSDGDDGEKNVIEDKTVTDKDLTILESTPVKGVVTPKWQDYYLQNYYQKFLPEEPSAKRGLVAEIPRDYMLAYISDNKNPFVDADKNANSKYYVSPGDQIVADGISLMKVDVQIYNANGQLDTTGTHQVKFSLESELTNPVTFENAGGNTVQSKNGVATAYLKAGTKTGSFKLKIEIVNSGLPIQEKEIFLVAGDPVAVDIVPESNFLVANGESETNVNLILKDKYGNVANNSYAEVVVFSDEEIFEIEKDADTRSDLNGIQLSTVEGKATVRIKAKEETGETKIYALLMEPELEELIKKKSFFGTNPLKKFAANGKEISVVDPQDISLKFTINTSSIKAGSKDSVKLRTELWLRDNLAAGYNGPIQFEIATPNLLKFKKETPKNMTAGFLHQENAQLKVTEVAGRGEVNVNLPGFISENVKIEVLPRDPKKIELTASENTLFTGARNSVTLEARLLDKYGNLVTTDNSTTITFSATADSESRVKFSGTRSAVALKGVAAVVIKGGNNSGKANIKANVNGSLTLKPATISLDVKKRVTESKVKSFSPRAMYVSLLGGAFADFANGKNIANALLFGGQTQAVSSLTSTKDDFKKMLLVSTSGKISILDEALTAVVTPATKSFPYQKIAFEQATVFLVPKDGIDLVALAENENVSGEGIFVNAISETAKANKILNNVFVTEGEQIKAKIDRFGRISLKDDTLSLRIPTEEDEINFEGLTLIISRGTEAIASVTFKQTQNLTLLNADDNTPAFSAGVYAKMTSNDYRYAFQKGFAENSTNGRRGVYLVDKSQKIPADAASNFNMANGFGFKDQNKHMLSFAAGDSVGESNISGSESEIVLGDPLVRVKKENKPDIEQDPVDVISDESGFTKDIGKLVYNGEDKIKKLITFDYNNDDFDDVALAYENGTIKLLKNSENKKRLVDSGNIIQVFSNILSIAKIDLNDDGFDDLVVGTEESCVEGEQCVSVYTNKNGNFERSTLNLKIEGKALEMKGEDMNDDECEDLVLTDTSGNLRIFYNKKISGDCTGLDTNYGYSKNFGFSLDSGVNMSDNLFINYGAMERPNGAANEIASNSYKFIRFNLPTSEKPTGLQSGEATADFSLSKYADQAEGFQNFAENNPEIAKKILPEQTYSKEFPFINVFFDNRLGINSTKYSIDENGAPVKLDDVITYEITLSNSSGANISNLMLSDAMPTTMTLVPDSLECVGCNDALEFVETGVNFRPQVIRNISVPANGYRKIRYQMKIEQMPMIDFELGKKLTVYPGHNNDPYTDILVRPKVNPGKKLIYLYSTGVNTNGQTVYQKYEVSSTGNRAQLIKNKADELGLPDFEDLLESIPETPDAFDNIDLTNPPNFKELMSSLSDEELNDIEVEKPSQETQEALSNTYQDGNQDSDYDGCPDTWGSTNFSSNGTAFSGEVEVGGEVAKKVSGAISNTMNLLRCSGAGCLPIPYNYAFLVPDYFIPGITLFSVSTELPPVLPFQSSLKPNSVFRFYMSPTLTMGLGFAACVGPPTLLNPCWAFAAPLQSLGVCPDFVGPVEDAVSGAQEYVNDFESNNSAILSDGEELPDSGDSTSETYNFFPEDSPIQAAFQPNIRIPGFPDFITDWVDRQTDEIYNKLLDFPDIYMIFPDFAGLGKDTVEAVKQIDDPFKKNVTGTTGEKVQGTVQSFNDFLNYVNTIPFIQIEPKEVTVKIPAISRKEIYKYKIQAQAFIDSTKKELNEWRTFWACDRSTDNKTICDAVTLDVTELIRSVEKFMNDLDELLKLPRKILTWRELEAKYALQIICYMDAIMEFMGGYLKRQERIIGEWISTIEEVIKMIQEWMVIIDLILDFKTNCDECKNHRFSKLGLLLSLLIVLPDPPIVPLPKWPDLVVDFSQFETGIKIVWPELKFKPEPIYLPNLPVLNLPDWTPAIDLKIPGFLVNFPVLNLPPLPDLPPLPLPKLPDLPRPPEIPPLPDFIFELAVNIKEILRIVCLLFKALMPVPEFALETEIETLTQPNVNIVLQLLAKLAVQLPPIEYDFVKEVRLTGKIGFTVDTNYVYAIVKNFAENNWNRPVKDFIKSINEYTAIDLQVVIDAAVKAFFDGLKSAIADGLGVCISYSGEGVEDKDAIRKCVDDTRKKCEEAAGNYAVEGDMAEKACEEQTKSYLKQNYASQYSVLYPEDKADTSKTTKTLQPAAPNYQNFYGEGTSEETIKQNNLNNDELQQIKNLLQASDFAPFKKLQNNVAELNEQLNEYVASLNYEEMPEVYYLKAEQQMIDSSHPLLNRSLSEIENKIAKEDLPESTGINRLKAARNSLISYVKNVNESELLIDEIPEDMLLSDFIASTNQNIGVRESEPVVAVSKVAGQNALEEIRSLVTDKNEKYKLIASIDQVQAYKDAATTTVKAPKGLFVISGDKNENVLNYTAEIGEGMTMAFNDIDDDGDSDLLVAMNGDLYLKENYKESPGYSEGDVLNVSLNNSIDDFLHSGVARVGDIATTYSTFEKTDISFSKSGNNVMAYEIILRKSLNHDMDEPTYKITKPVSELSDPENPTVSLNIQNGNYYVNVFALDANGNRSAISETTVTSPSVCSDREAPIPVVSPAKLEIPVFKELLIDARKSYDVEGKINSYYLETIPYTNGDKAVTTLPQYMWSDKNILNDSDGDGIKYNDRDNPLFRIGPFGKEGDLGIHKFILHVVDQSGNSGKQEIEVSVVAPEITLDSTLNRVPEATGKTIPSLSEVPFSLFRKRYVYRVIDSILTLIPRVEKVITSSVGANGKYLTDANGDYLIKDLNSEDMITVENSEAKIIAEIHPQSGNIGILDNAYTTVVNAATLPDKPTSIQIVRKGGEVLGTLYPVADPNSDVQILAENEKHLFGGTMQVRDLIDDDDFTFKSFSGDHPVYPGGAAMENMLVVDSAGNIILLNSDITLRQKKNNYFIEPLIIEVRYKNKTIAEVYMSPLPDFKSTMVVGPNDVPYATPREPAYLGLLDSENTTGLLQEIFDKGIIDPKAEFDEEEYVTRAEFTRILLNMLCIIPRQPEAYAPYEADEAGGGFSDISFKENNLEWYYPYVKEAAMLGLIQGYGAEKNENGLPPFKPDETISRAEATKIILEGLEYKGFLDLSSLPSPTSTEPWYKYYIEAAQDLTPYLVDPVLQNNYVITLKEANNPDKPMKMGELITMTGRVLEIYECSESVKVEEEQPAIKPVQNVSGGFNGIYLVPADCNSCPCSASVSHKADVINGDTFFTSISSFDENYIFSKSNEVTYEKN